MNGPFDRVNFGLRERPVSSDFNRAQSQIYRTIAELSRAMLSGRASDSSAAAQARSGFVGDGLRVVPSSPAAMSVQVSAGYGFLYNPVDIPTDIGATDLEDVDDLALFKPVFLLTPVTFPIVAPSAGNSRIDVIEVKIDRRLEDAIVRRQLDVTTKTFADHSFYKTLAFGLDGRTGIVNSPANSTAGISYKIGAESLVPAAPPTTAGYVKIAEVRTASGTTTVNGSHISDRRVILGPSGIVRCSATFRVQWNGGTPIITASNIVAPPGVEIGAKAITGARGALEVFAIAGEVTKATVRYVPHTDNTVVGDTAVIMRNRRDATPLVDTLTSGEQAELAAATPAILTGFAAKRVRAYLESVHLDGSGTPSQTAAALEDMSVTVDIDLAYH